MFIVTKSVQYIDSVRVGDNKKKDVLKYWTRNFKSRTIDPDLRKIDWESNKAYLNVNDDKITQKSMKLFKLCIFDKGYYFYIPLKPLKASF